MTINKVTLNSAIPGATGKISATDNESKNLQNQLLNERQRLNRISSDVEMSTEEKAKERQEIRKQIAELNRKLRQQQVEQKKEAKEAAKEEAEKQFRKEEYLRGSEAAKQSGVTSQDSQELNASAKNQEPSKFQELSSTQESIEDVSLPVASVNTILSAQSVIRQERIQEQVAMEKAGRENILEAEIQLDSIYGTDNERKKAELSDLRREKSIQISDIGEKETKSDSAYQSPKIIIKE